MKNKTFKKFIKIWIEAKEEAQKAVDNCDITPEFGYCGFAWVTISDKGNFAKFTEFIDASTKGYSKERTIWYSKIYNGSSQDMRIHKVACEAFVNVLRKNNINCEVGYRLD